MDLVFHLNDIPEGGLTAVRDLTSQYILEMVGPIYRPAPDNVKLDCLLRRAGEAVHLRAALSVRMTYDCSLCAEESQRILDLSFTHLFTKGEEGDVKLSDGDVAIGADDVGDTSSFEGETIDTEPVLRENLVLSLVPYPKCSEGCRGLCPMCGTNLNQGSCSCKQDTVNPLWDALRAVKPGR